MIDVIPTGGKGKHVKGGWVEDYKPFTDVRSRLVAKQIAHGSRDDVTQSAPALLIFRLLLALACSGLAGLEACFAVFHISVAFFHAKMDELVLVHPPRDKVPEGFCWRLRRTMYGTRRAS